MTVGSMFQIRQLGCDHCPLALVEVAADQVVGHHEPERLPRRNLNRRKSLGREKSFAVPLPGKLKFAGGDLR